MDWFYQLTDCMNTYFRATDVAITVFQPDGSVAKVIGPEYSYCKIFQQECGRYCPCQRSHSHACLEADRLRDGFFFSCPAGYVHFAVPVYVNQKLAASILAGPVALEYPDLDLIDNVIQQYDLSLSSRYKLYGAYSSAPLVEPQRARYLCKLLVALVSNLSSMEDNQFLAQQAKKNVQQAKIGEYIQLIKSDSRLAMPQYEREQQFIADVLSGNMDHAKALLNEMIGQIYFASGNNFEIIRTRCIELLALLSRAIMENGVQQEDVYEMTDSAMRSLTAAKDLTDLSYILLEILDSYFAVAFSKYPVQDSPTMLNALRYISEHYSEPITLSTVAGAVGLNESYFSTLFKKKMDVSFSDYLTETRITHAKFLLKKSDMPLVEVALAVGFDSQSYFTRVFKRCTGVTPKQYRDRT